MQDGEIHLMHAIASPEKRKRVAERCVDIEGSVIDAFRQMDSLDCKLLIVTHSGRYMGLLSAGDIQRNLVAGGSLTGPIRGALGRSVRVANPSVTLEEVRAIMLRSRAELMPVVDDNGALHDVIFWDELFVEPHRPNVTKLTIPTVIMAGGQGTRLKPLTNIIPKPLVPIGERPIIEIIMDSFHAAGVEDFYVSVNYKADMIERYFADKEKAYQIHYFSEPRPLGTAGSLSLLRGRFDSAFFVSNCDILIAQDYQEVFAYHRENRCDLTVVAALKTYPIPYGTLETGSDGLLQSLKEKPTLSILANTGVYLLEPHLLSQIPDDTMLHITELIDRVRAANGRVGVFPITEGSWLDIGDWPEYQKSQELFQRRPVWSPMRDVTHHADDKRGE